MRKRFLFLLTFSSLTFMPCFGQPSPSPSPAPEPEKEADFSTLVEQTLPQDIETASYYELAAWCRLLKLDESGDKQALQARLKAYFKTESAAEKKAVIRKVVIKSARSSEYFTLDEIDEDYVLIQGNVSLELSDAKDNTVHTIRAERILYNQTKNTITATGSVEYTRQRGDKKEIFKGETFDFDIGNWEGVLYFGEGQRTQEVEGQTVVFRYYGETVSRMADNSIILENGVITSSTDVDNPNYRITASRVIVLAPGEWAVENAVLYIGHIPVLYLPFFYYTMDELFFNPVVGYKLREGAFWQNTIYFIGKETREDTMLSFLQLEEANDQDYELGLDGLFLRPLPKTTTSQPQAAGLAGQIKHLKMFADIYSRLGFFTGVSLDMTPHLKLFGGIAFSRSIFYNSAYGDYTPFYPFNQGPDHWNSGNFFGVILPLRFGLETEFDLSSGILQKITGKFYLFSDPLFAQNFYSREETQNWGEVIGFELAERAAATTALSPAVQRTSLVWTLNLRIGLAPLFQTPLLANVTIDPLSFTFDWNSRSVDNPTADPVIAADPASVFYYPQRIIFPNIGLTMSGSLLQYTASNAVTAQTGPRTGPGPGKTDVRLPFTEDPGAAGTEESAPQADSQGELEKPGFKPDLPIDRTMRYFTTAESYFLNHTFKIENLFDHEDWETVADIDYALLSSIFDHTGNTRFDYQFSFLNSMLDLRGNFSLAEKYRITYQEGAGFSQSDTDKANTALDVTSTVSFSYAPFVNLPDFRQTRVAYDLRWDFYDIYFNGVDKNYYERFFVFSRDTVAVQQLRGDFIYQPEDKPHSLKFRATLPPLLGSLYTELNFYLSIFQTTAVLEYKEQAGGTWRFEPLKITEKAVWENYFSFSASYQHNLEDNLPLRLEGNASFWNYRYQNRDRYLLIQELSYDFSDSAFDLSRTILDLWDFKTTLFAQWMHPLSPLGTTSADWEFLLYKLNFSYYLTTGDLYFWENRIALNTNITTALELDFQKHVASFFTLDLQFMLKIHRFMDLSLKISVRNDNVFRYFPGFVDAVNADPLAAGASLEPVNFFEDLLKSFNFFNIEDRYDSFFKLKSLGVELTHYLDDWIFKLSFTGVFQNQLGPGGSQVYTWVPAFSFSLKWLPIPQIERSVTGNASGLVL